VLQGLPGVHAFHSGNDWEFSRPILVGDRITPESTFTGFDIKEGKFGGRFVMEHQEARYLNQRGELVAKAKTWLVRAERPAARERGKYGGIKLPHPWTEEELARVEADVLAERPRGAEPRYWEDVQVGDAVGPVTKGPLGLTDIVAYCVGSAPVQILAHRAALLEYQRHPAWAFRDPETGALEPVYGVHYNKQAARSAGLPFPYDAGAQRHAWHIQLFLDWMGDEGWLKKDYGEYRRFVYLSDAVKFTGKVTRKFVDADGEPCVEIETEAINQRGENVLPGRGTVVLPSRERKYWPLEGRLPR
jgi:acyl dehydratase